MQHTTNLPYFRLLFPSLFAGPFFIFLTEKPLRSAVDVASPLFEKRFFPPNPYFLSFLWRLKFEPSLPPFSALDLEPVSSSAMSKRSSSPAVAVPFSAPLRSIRCQ